MPVARPGITEIDVDSVHLAGGENLCQISSVTINEKDIVQVHGTYPLHGNDHGVGDPFHRDIESLGILRRSLSGKAAFAAAQFQEKFLCLGHQTLPVAPQGLGIGNQYTGTALHPRRQIGLFSHSHQ